MPSTSSCSSARARWPRQRRRPQGGHLAGGAGRPAGGGGSLAAAFRPYRFGQRRRCVPSPRASPWSGCCWRPTPSLPSSPSLSTGAGARHRSGAAGGGSRHGDEVRSVDSLRWRKLPGVAGAGAGAGPSRQTQVESLFIDEGFGTLDPDSLDLALSSLDSLQARTPDRVISTCRPWWSGSACRCGWRPSAEAKAGWCCPESCLGLLINRGPAFWRAFCFSVSAIWSLELGPCPRIAGNESEGLTPVLHPSARKREWSMTLMPERILARIAMRPRSDALYLIWFCWGLALLLYVADLHITNYP